jgi:hypothetical protein
LPEANVEQSDTGDSLSDEGSILVLTGGVADHRDFAAAPRVMAQAAARLALQGISVTLVGSAPDALPAHRPDRLRILPRLPVTEMVREIGVARIVICNGGDTLVQVLALRRACVALAMAADQELRLRRCRTAGLDVQSAIDVSQLVSKAAGLWSDPIAQSRQLHIVSGLEVCDASETVLAAIVRLAAMADGSRLAADRYSQGLA